MKKINYFAISKIAICLLCCLLMITIIGRPITANAVVAETVVLGTAGIGSLSVVLPVAIITVAVVAIYGLIDGDLVSTVGLANNWYNTSTSLRNWADQVATQVKSGATTVYVPPAVSNFFNEQKSDDEKIGDISSLTLPASFLAMELIRQNDIFSNSVSGILTEGNSIALGTNSLLSTISQSFTNTFSGFKTSFESLRTKLTSFYDSVGAGLTTVNNNMMSRLDLLKTTVNETKSALASRLEAIPNKLEGVKTGIVTGISDLASSITYRVDNIYNRISTKTDELKTSISAVPGTIVKGFENAISSLEIAIKEAFANGAVTTPPTNNENNLMNNAQNGGNKVIGVIGRGKDLISQFGPALLAVGAVLTKFMNVPVVGDLIYFSLALGIFALAVNLGNMILSNSESDARGKKHTGNNAYSSARGG